MASILRFPLTSHLRKETDLLKAANSPTIHNISIRLHIDVKHVPACSCMSAGVVCRSLNVCLEVKMCDDQIVVDFGWRAGSCISQRGHDEPARLSLSKMQSLLFGKTKVKSNSPERSNKSRKRQAERDSEGLR